MEKEAVDTKPKLPHVFLEQGRPMYMHLLSAAVSRKSTEDLEEEECGWRLGKGF